MGITFIKAAVYSNAQARAQSLLAKHATAVVLNVQHAPEALTIV